jgi:hypothetical protein
MGRALSPAYRALALLAAASGKSVAELSELPLGRRDELLLTMREWAFGPDLACVTACPTCEERLETIIPCEQIRCEPPAGLNSIEVDGYSVRLRPPATADLLAAERADPDEVNGVILARCSDLSHDAPPSVADAVIDGMKAADPQAQVELTLDCPACLYHWTALFDILPFFWKEIDVWARRTLQDIHLLASAYGWTQSEVLALTAARRRTFIEMVSA